MTKKTNTTNFQEKTNRAKTITYLCSLLFRKTTPKLSVKESRNDISNIVTKIVSSSVRKKINNATNIFFQRKYAKDLTPDWYRPIKIENNAKFINLTYLDFADICDDIETILSVTISEEQQSKIYSLHQLIDCAYALVAQKQILQNQQNLKFIATSKTRI